MNYLGQWIRRAVLSMRNKCGLWVNMQSSWAYQGWVCHTGLSIIRWSTFSLITFAWTWLIMPNEGKHNPHLDSNIVALHWSLYCWGLVSKLHTVSTGYIGWMHRSLLLVGQKFSLSPGKIFILSCSLHGKTPNLLSHSVCVEDIL